MAVTIEIPGVLRRYSEDRADVPVEGARVRAALDGLFVRFPGLRARMLDAEGELFPYLQLFLDGAELPREGLMDVELRSDCVLEIVGAAEGG
jgi:hypothetical protein